MARPKGVKNPSTIARERARAVLAMPDASPVDFLLALMRSDEFPLAMRQAAARDAAPYIHPRLQSVLHVDGRQQQTALGELLDELDGQTRGLLSHDAVPEEQGAGDQAPDGGSES